MIKNHKLSNLTTACMWRRAFQKFSIFNKLTETIDGKSASVTPPLVGEVVFHL